MTQPANSKNQRQRILDLLLAAHGSDVPGVALSRISLQYGARVKELREMGCRITNHTERRGGKVCGYFKLESVPALAQPSSHSTIAVLEPSSFPEFGSLEPERYGV
jgi:hypothetical protein